MTATISAWNDTPTHTLDVGGTSFAYRQLGPRGGTPLVFLHHFTAVLDDWDPRVIDPIIPAIAAASTSTRSRHSRTRRSASGALAEQRRTSLINRGAMRPP